MPLNLSFISISTLHVQLIVLIVIYLSSVHFFWKPENKAHFVVAGQSMWIAIASYLCSFLGALQVPALLLVMSYVIASTAYHLQTTHDHDSSSFLDRLQKLFDRNDFEKSLSICRKAVGEPTLQSDVEDISLSETVDSEDTFDAKPAEETEGHQSDTYFKLLFYACLGTFLYRNIWLFILAAVPVFLHLLYTAGSYTGITQFVCNKINDAYHGVRVSSFIIYIYLLILTVFFFSHCRAGLWIIIQLCCPYVCLAFWSLTTRSIALSGIH